MNTKKSLLKKLLPVAVVGAGLAVAGTAMAADSGWQTIRELEANAKDGTLIVTAGSFDPGPCANDASFVILDVNGAGAALSKIAMAAFLAGKQVRATFTGDCTPAFNIAGSLEVALAP